MERKKHLILVVDDDRTLLDSLCDYLSYKGYEVKGEENGYNVLVLCEQLIPDLIISDIRMPKLDGISLLKGLKYREETRDIPVIFMSAYADDELVKKARDMGASYFLGKPFQLESLDKFIDKVFAD